MALALKLTYTTNTEAFHEFEEKQVRGLKKYRGKEWQAFSFCNTKKIFHELTYITKVN